MQKKSLFKLITMAVLMLAVMLAMFPGKALAANDGGEEEQNGLHAGKYITVEEDGTYTIDLDAYATGEATFDTVTVPADIILVLDVSGSMTDNMTGASYTYTARPSQAYTYSNYGSNQYYYLDNNGNYNRVERNSNNGRYYLRYGTQGNRTYLTGTTTQNSRPSNAPTSTTGTIWTGVLYERTEAPAVTKMDALKTAVNSFIDEVAAKNAEVAEANPDAENINDKLSRIAIVKFAGNSRNGTNYSNYYNNIGNETYRDGNYTYNYTQVVADLGLVTEDNKQNTWKTKVDAFTAAGATSADYGMGYANAIVDRHANDYNYTDESADNYRSRVVVMFTDGEPNHSRDFDATVANTTITTSRTLKTTKNTTVYTVAVYNGADPSLDPTASSTSNINKYLHGVSSNYPNASSYTNLGTRGEGNYYFAATSADELENIFKEIGKSSGESATEIGSSAVMKDVVSSSFTLPKDASVDDIDIKIVRWNSTTHKWGTGEGYEFTPEQWATVCLNYGAESAENVVASISEDGTNVDVTGFDYSTHYKATNAEQDNDQYDVVGGVNKYTAKIVVSFPIQAKPSAITGSSVATNGEESGIYYNGEMVVKFDVPEVEFTPVTYVVDYVTSDTSTDTKASTIKLDYSGVLSNVEMLDDPSDDYLIGDLASKFKYTIYKGKYGTISFGDDATDVQRRYVRYAPTTMNWDGYDRIFVKGDSKTESDLDVWAMLCVLPANSVFYEDTYISQTKEVEYNGQTVTIEYTGIAYTGDWNTVGTEGKNQTQHADKDADGNPIPQGWIDGLADDSDYANDMAHTSSTAKAKASFTFSGTGMDIYSRTNGSTGTISVSLKSAAADNESGKKVTKTKIIDNKAAAGDFYAVPVCTFTDLPYGKYTATITVTAGGQSEGRMTFYLDGVRVYNPIKPLEGEENVIEMYGEKNIGAVFTEVRSLLGTGAEADALYIDEMTTGEEVTDLDAIEAAAQALAAAQADYDAYVEANVTPAKNAISTAEYALQGAKDAVTSAQNIYDADPSDENRQALEAAQAALVEAQAEYDGKIDGLQDALDEAIAGKADYVAAIEEAREAYDTANEAVDVSYITEDVVKDYDKDGPKSELYLSKGQQVAINVEAGKYYYIGLRSLNGGDVTCTINGASKTLSHTVDLYYEATPANNGTRIVIKNTGDAILAITKLRTTGEGNTTNGIRKASTAETMAYIRSLADQPESEYTGEVLTEEEAKVEAAAAADAVTEEVLDESAITIENAEPVVTENEPEAEKSTDSFLSGLMSSFSRFFRH